MKAKARYQARAAVLILLAVLLGNLLVRANAHAGLARAGALCPADPALPYRNAALFARLCAGDFSCLDEPRESRREGIAACCRQATERNAIHWQLADLNGGVGGFLSWESTYECRMDASGGLTIGQGLCIYHLDAEMAECETDDWMPQQPGTYYGRYDPASGQTHVGMLLAPFQTVLISKEEYEEAFLRLTGFAAQDPFA